MKNNALLLLRCATGTYLRAGPSGLALTAHPGDDGLWRWDGDLLRSAGSGAKVAAERLGDGRIRLLDAADVADVFTLHDGPTRLPSEHVQELRTTGLTVLENVLDGPTTARVKAQVAAESARQHPDASPTDGRLWLQDAVSWSLELAQACTHPVALGVMQQYLGTDEIHYCHPPIATTMRPAGKLLNSFPEGGWHSDYPYHVGVFPDEHWPKDPVFGVQFNICIDAFRADNAGTQYLPGSHRLCRRPSRDFNLGGTRMGEGLHESVRQMIAPAGSALIYDSRTWHRACDELNVSGEERVAILNAVTPAWVLPMSDKAAGAAVYQNAPTRALLTDRERADIERLCNAPTRPTPLGMPTLQQRKPVPAGQVAGQGAQSLSGITRPS